MTVVLLCIQAAESEVAFGTLDGSDVRVGLIRTRWNDEHVTNLVNGCRKALKECNVAESNIFETSVPGCYELPMAAKYLALSGTVDVIVTPGVLIKGDVSRFVWWLCDTRRYMFKIGYWPKFTAFIFLGDMIFCYVDTDLSL